MKIKIYVLFGTSGQYSDRREWTVCAFAKKEDAEKRKTQAEKWYQQKIASKPEASDIVSGWEWWDKQKNKWDRRAGTQDYSDNLNYYIEEVDLISPEPKP